MQYSPKLKRVMEQIKGILIEEDIEGVVVLHHEKWSEILNHVETSNSCAKIEGDAMRFKIDSKKIGREKADIIARNTFNFVTHFSEILMTLGMSYMQSQISLKKKWNGNDDEEGRFTSNTTQQN